MIKKEKLLIVSAISPFPKISGGAVRIYNTIKYLSEKYELYLVFLKSAEYILSSEETLFLNEHVKYFTFFNQKNVREKYSFINKFQPYLFSDSDDDELKIFLPKFIKENQIKKVQIEFTQLLYLCQFIPKDVYKIFVALDVSTVSFWRRLLELKNLWQILFNFSHWMEIFLYEKYFLTKFNLVISMSTKDQLTLKKEFGLKNVVVIPNGVEKITFLDKKPKRIVNLGYIGSFIHPPNHYAISFFINEIAPLLEKSKINFRYFIAGANNSDSIKSIINFSSLKSKSKIINLGKVNKVEDFYKKINILIAPIFSGSGTRIKILEALSFGVPVITSAIGAEGININNQYLSIVNSKNEFIKEIIKFTKKNSKLNEDELIKLKNSIRPLLWKNIFKKYSKII